MKRIYIKPVCKYSTSSYEDAVLLYSTDLNQQGTSVRIDDDDTSGNAWEQGRSNTSLWDDPDAEI